MTLKRPLIILICFLGLLSSCTSESERILSEKIANEKFHFNKLNKGIHNISYQLKDNVQYGLIDLEDGVQIKFWFLTHHVTSDIGGTIYEYPNGERQFCSGLHCCEVKFYENGNLGKIFKDIEEFKMFVLERDGIRP